TSLLETGPHQHDPAPGRVHLLVPQQIGRARRQAEATVDAVLDQAQLRRAPWVEGCGHAQIPPTNRPGLQTPAGPKLPFSRRVSAMAEGSCPQTSILSRTSSGAS